MGSETISRLDHSSSENLSHHEIGMLLDDCSARPNYLEGQPLCVLHGLIGWVDDGVDLLIKDVTVADTELDNSFKQFGLSDSLNSICLVFSRFDSSS